MNLTIIINCKSFDIFDILRTKHFTLKIDRLYCWTVMFLFHFNECYVGKIRFLNFLLFYYSNFVFIFSPFQIWNSGCRFFSSSPLLRLRFTVKLILKTLILMDHMTFAFFRLLIFILKKKKSQWTVLSNSVLFHYIINNTYVYKYLHKINIIHFSILDIWSYIPGLVLSSWE